MGHLVKMFMKAAKSSLNATSNCSENGDGLKKEKKIQRGSDRCFEQLTTGKIHLSDWRDTDKYIKELKRFTVDLKARIMLNILRANNYS